MVEKKEKYGVSLVMVSIFVITFYLCIPVSAAILFDDFNDDSGVLTGETASTGQTWAEISTRTSLDIGAQFGQSGTAGAGNEVDTADWKANQIALGQVVNNGTIILEADIKKQHRTSPVNEVDIALKSSTQGKTTSLIWAADHLKIGGDWTFGGPDISLSPWPQTDIHATLTLNLNAGGTNSASISWFEIGNPDNSGSTDASATIVGALNYDTVEVWAYTAGTKITGVDNISIVIPQPATIGLLMLGMVGLFRYRQKK